MHKNIIQNDNPTLPKPPPIPISPIILQIIGI